MAHWFCCNVEMRRRGNIPVIHPRIRNEVLILSRRGMTTKRVCMYVWSIRTGKVRRGDTMPRVRTKSPDETIFHLKILFFERKKLCEFLLAPPVHPCRVTLLTSVTVKGVKGGTIKGVTRSKRATINISSFAHVLMIVRFDSSVRILNKETVSH